MFIVILQREYFNKTFMIYFLYLFYYKMDLYARDAGAIQSGNMRTQAQQRLGEAISLHNSELAGQTKLEQGQLAQQRSQQIIEGIMSGYMDARGLQNGMKEYGMKIIL